jgi:hypothetical protein
MTQHTNKITTVSSVLKTVASEEIVTASELNAEDRPLEEVLDETKEDTEQSKRD